jgi:predicted nuclease of predicted toxin-antitoxin system
MKFLLDANLSPRLAAVLGDAGFATTHVVDHNLADATDQTIFDFAAAEQFVVITADSDFTMLLAARHTTTPSVVLLRHVAELRPDAHAALLAANLPLVLDDLAAGAVVSLSPARLAVRRLPIA